MKNERSVCWFGYADQNQNLKAIVEKNLQKEVLIALDAAEGLEEIAKKDYSLVIFNYATPAETLKLPRNIRLGDWVSTDCYIIGRIREAMPETPIIVTHISSFPGHEYCDAVRKYMEAGATDLFDFLDPKAEKEFADFLKKHLSD